MTLCRYVRCYGRSSSVRYGELNEIWFTTSEKKHERTEKLAMMTRTGHGSGIWYVVILSLFHEQTLTSSSNKIICFEQVVCSQGRDVLS